MILSLLIFVTLILVAFIAGSTLYISLVEVPARKAMPTKSAHENWLQTFPRAMKLMKLLGLIAVLLVLLCFIFSLNPFWIGTLIPLFTIGPYTAKFLSPTNNWLLENRNHKEAEIREHLDKWGKGHLNRTYMAGFGFVCALIAGLS